MTSRHTESVGHERSVCVAVYYGLVIIYDKGLLLLSR